MLSPQLSLLFPALVVCLLPATLLAQGQDNCVAAQPISGTGLFAFNNSAALTDGLADGLCDFAGSQQIFNDVWFSWTAPADGVATVSTCGLTTVDTKLAVYEGGCFGTVLVCEDDSCGLQSEVSWLTSSGDIYLLRVGVPVTAVGGTGQFSLGLAPIPQGSNYCTATANSSGFAARISATGSLDPLVNSFQLQADRLPPNKPGIFFYGPAQVSFPFGNGVLCVGGGGVGLYRLNPPVYSDAAGLMQKAVNFLLPPQPSGQILFGSTWNFQCWFRDPVGGGAAFNLSDGLEVLFVPSGDYAGMSPIPAGTFEMGRHVGGGLTDELPLHAVTLDAFYMDTFEVTNEGFAAYLNRSLAEGRVTVTGGVATQVGGAGQAICDTTGSDGSSGIEWIGTAFSARAGREDHPVGYVSWFGSCLYANDRSRQAVFPVCYDETTFACDFTALGMRLPTEAEWEYAARGGEHAPYLAYPWGDTIDGSKANYLNSGDPFDGTWGPIPESTPVGYYDGGQSPAGVDMANGYGLYDMSGNMSEWCHDWYGSTYYSTSPPSSPTGPASGSGRVVRCGGWGNSETGLRSANRNSNVPTDRNATLGLRVLSVRP